ncbi:MAG: hypothetical protein M1817_006832 [Caeruleum heppii]|nr:MAG: hypothetical protein M1817_006832 [Caeruleum heppii]
MSAFLNSMRQNFGRPSNKNTTNPQQQQKVSSPTTANPPAFPQSQPGSQNPSAAASPRLPALPLSNPSFSMGGNEQQQQQQQQPQSAGGHGGSNAVPLFMTEAMQSFIVKGNHMTLAAKPKSVELGEWLAHHVVEQFRLLSQFIIMIQSSYRKNGQVVLICNQQDCPTMSAGSYTYTWLDSNRQPTRLPAAQYIGLVSRWISGKILDPTLFPTDSTSVAATNATFASGGPPTPGGAATPPIAAGPTSLNVPLAQLAHDWVGKSSGFPEAFLSTCKNIYKQMFRVYAHMYWRHFENPFYNLGLERHFNSAFVHFLIVGTEYDLLASKDLEPLQPLLDAWLASNVLPMDSRIAQAYATNARQGQGQGQG